MKPFVLLLISNVFMTVAWYGHLKFGKTWPMWVVILASWGIAFFEYCFQVPANRIGYAQGYSASALKIIQEAITLVVFCVFARTVLHEHLRWNHYAGICLVMLAVVVVNYNGGDRSHGEAPSGEAPTTALPQTGSSMPPSSSGASQASP